MTRSSANLGVLVAVLLFPMAAFGVPVAYHTTLSGDAESPPIPSDGTGTATLVIDTDAHTLEIDTVFSDLEADTTVAHIHCCILPNAGIASALPTFPGFPAGVTAGSYSQTFDLTLAASWNPAFVAANGGTTAGAEAALAAALEAGVAYINIHTTFAPGGEIRGFFVPEPAAALLLGAGALASALARRRSSRR